ncbi:hypothetical protein F5Y12DRAFT_719737 [Xylaria sp. FL1777]|nr:hypothetical protein F5Y12DRAFT_719737 [Xylaria sp. FL1777]
MAVAEALFTLRLQNINEALDENERDKKISNMENALRVKLYSVRKKYGVVIKPRRRKHATASTDSAKLMNPTTLQTVYASHHSSALSDGNSPTRGNVVPRKRCSRVKHFRLAAHDEIECDGSQHTNYFATDALFGGPARRLGIQIRYQELETSLRETRDL